jgi:hypothetical protein
MFDRLSLLVFNWSFILRVILVNSNPLGPAGLPSVKSELPLDRLNMNDLVGEVSVEFYQGVN